MKSLTSFILLFMTLSAFAQSSDFQQHVSSQDAILKTLYDVISGEKGEARNWELFEFLFHKDAKLIPTGKSPEGKGIARFMTPKEYQATSGKWLVENGFFEKEVSRKTENYGNITHVFSTYESFRTQKDTQPFMRGINSIQLFNDGTRWWILNVFWMHESEEFPLPKKYLD